MATQSFANQEEREAFHRKARIIVTLTTPIIPLIFFFVLSFFISIPLFVYIVIIIFFSFAGWQGAGRLARSHLE